MNKEEILSKSRTENKNKADEWAVFINHKSREFGIKALTIVFCVLTIFNILAGQSNHALYAMYFIYLGFYEIGKFKVKKEKMYIIFGIISTLYGVFRLVLYVLTVLKIIEN